MSRSFKALAFVVGAWLALRAWATLRPTAFPYFAWRVLDLPRPALSRARLLRMLGPAPGERMLEVGPGTGYYTLPVAAAVAPAGAVEIVDIRQSFLNHTMRRAHAEDLANVVPTRGDAMSLPFPSDHFDGAFLVSVLGEISDPQAALRELRRVLKPAGRLVVGEIVVDPDFTTCPQLVKLAAKADLALDGRAGPFFGYFARFRPSAPP